MGLTFAPTGARRFARVRVERGVSRSRILFLAAAHCIERHEGERKRDSK